MKERPILFSGSMVQAILNGTKTQTRRVVQPQPIHKWGSGVSTLHHPDYFSAHVELPGEREYQWIRCPYGKPGELYDILTRTELLRGAIGEAGRKLFGGGKGSEAAPEIKIHSVAPQP